MFETHRIYVAIADGAGARFFRRATRGAPLELVQELTHPDSRRPSRDLVSDRPGRPGDSSHSQQHSFGEDVSPQEREKLAFAHVVAQALDAAEAQYDELVLVAPPRFLGSLRPALTARTSGKVKRELALDLTKVPAEELPARLEG